MNAEDEVFKIDLKSKILYEDASHKPLAKAKINLLLAFEVKKWYTVDMFGNVPSGKNPQLILEDLRSKSALFLLLQSILQSILV